MYVYAYFKTKYKIEEPLSFSSTSQPLARTNRESIGILTCLYVCLWNKDWFLLLTLRRHCYHQGPSRWRIIYVLTVAWWWRVSVHVRRYLLCMSACLRKCENWMGSIILGCLSFPYAQITVWSYIYRMTFIIYNVSHPDKQHFPHPSHTHYT